uniref:SFRICE_024213 n=1 Tax=Spodoptera frugiperda TaxID=7108 RepID=A0A2H1V581_SPOFR
MLNKPQVNKEYKSSNMALCESQLDSALPQLKREESPNSEGSQKPSPDKKPKMDHNGEIYGLNQVPSGLPLTVDYRSPVSHFVPPELYAPRPKQEPISSASSYTPESSEPPTPVKRKRGRPRVDKTSPEYLANLAARKQAKEMAAMMNSSRTPESGEKRKRGRPRVDKTSPEYLARKRARELEDGFIKATTLTQDVLRERSRSEREAVR